MTSLTILPSTFAHITKCLRASSRYVLQLSRNPISKPINCFPIPIIPPPNPKATPPTPHQPTKIIFSPIPLQQHMALQFYFLFYRLPYLLAFLHRLIPTALRPRPRATNAKRPNRHLPRCQRRGVGRDEFFSGLDPTAHMYTRANDQCIEGGDVDSIFNREESCSNIWVGGKVGGYTLGNGFCRACFASVGDKDPHFVWTKSAF